MEKKYYIITNSDVQGPMKMPRDDDHLMPYVCSDHVGNLEYAKAGYERLLENAKKGYGAGTVSFVSREICEQEIASLEKRIKEKGD